MSLSGDWKVELEFVRGHARHALNLTQEAEQVSGRYRTQFGVQETHGRVEGDRIDLRASIHHQACGATYRFTGQVDGDLIEGDVDLGEYWTARFRAQRQA